jgi:hypothetical protein
MTILTRMRKRLRILRAALTQDWHEHTCPQCQSRWFCQVGLCEGQLCASCDAALYEGWRVNDLRNSGAA